MQILFFWNAISSTLLDFRKIELPKYNVPVYSLVTLNTNDLTSNMNIITYANAVGIRPDPLWSISLYKKTKSYENFKKHGLALLQQLDMHRHRETIEILGKKSGYDIDKLKMLESLDIPICNIDLREHYSNLDFDSNTNGCNQSSNSNYYNPSIPLKMTILKDSINILILKRRSINEVIAAGDHEVFFCQVIGSFTLLPQQDEVENQQSFHTPMNSNYLRENNLI